MKYEDIYCINDPLDEIHIHVSGDHCSYLKFVGFEKFLKRGQTDGQTPHVNIEITNGRDCGSAWWIKTV